MNADRLDQALQAAIAGGLLPATATRPAQDSRPWPVLLLTALGAWLAALPLLGVVGLLLGDLISRGTGPYVIGPLVLAGAAVVFRARELPLFIEQLAVPALLVGGGTLGFGLFRDLPMQAAALLLALVALGLAFAIPRAWLRVLLGAATAVQAAMACMPQRWVDSDPADGMTRFWFAWHAVFALWGLAQWLLHRGTKARIAAALESISAGWLVATLAGLAWWSGMSFLVSGSLGGGFAGEVARELGSHRAGWQAGSVQAASVGFAVVAALWAARSWSGLKQLWLAGVASVLAVLAWYLPSLGAVLLALAFCATTQRWRLAGAAALAAAWIIGSFYYQLHWPLATKAAVLVAAGALLGGLAWLAHGGRARVSAAKPAMPPATTPRAVRGGIVVCALAVLAVSGFGIWQKEALIAHGRPVYVELAPVDPRSLTQGDYMRLNFRIPADVDARLSSLVTLERPRVVAQRDARSVARLTRLDDGTPLADGELRIELTPKDGRWILVSDAWYFREGDADRWAKARYGEFRVGADGKALLVGMADEQLRPIRP